MTATNLTCLTVTLAVLVARFVTPTTIRLALNLLRSV